MHRKNRYRFLHPFLLTPSRRNEQKDNFKVCARSVCIIIDRVSLKMIRDIYIYIYMQLCSWLKGVHYSFDLSGSLDASRSQLMRCHQQIFSGGTGTEFIFFHNRIHRYEYVSSGGGSFENKRLPTREN